MYKKTYTLTNSLIYPIVKVVEDTPSASGFNLKDRKTILAIAGFLVLLAAVPLGVYLTQQKQIFKPKAFEEKPISVPQAAFTIIAPKNITVGSQVRVSVLARSDLDAANLFVAKIKYPSTLLKFESIDLLGGASFVKNWVESIGDESGVDLTGGVPAPGFKTNVGESSSRMADIIFTAKASGDAKITFAPESAIYRNSDNADILSAWHDTEVKILSQAATASPSPTKQIPTTGVVILGDVNLDKKVNLVDMSSLLTLWNKSGQGVGADLNNDGLVNTFDYSLMRNILIENNIIRSN